MRGARTTRETSLKHQEINNGFTLGRPSRPMFTAPTAIASRRTSKGLREITLRRITDAMMSDFPSRHTSERPEGEKIK